MTTIFPVHTKESATPEGRQALERLQAAVGVIPNLAGAMAESPALLNAFLDLRERYAQTGFSDAEIQILSLVSAFENGCRFCVAFHTAMALKAGVAAESVDRLRHGQSPLDTRSAALSEYARLMVKQRGRAGADALKTFQAAGFTKEQALNVVLGLAFSVLANYSGHLTEAPIDAFLEPHAWKP